MSIEFAGPPGHLENHILRRTPLVQDLPARSKEPVGRDVPTLGVLNGIEMIPVFFNSKFVTYPEVDNPLRLNNLTPEGVELHELSFPPELPLLLPPLFPPFAATLTIKFPLASNSKESKFP